MIDNIVNIVFNISYLSPPNSASIVYNEFNGKITEWDDTDMICYSVIAYDTQTLHMNLERI